jgi:hypothetical protein
VSDPNAKVSAENVAKATKNKKSKEGRHVGLDFIDLLIEVLIDTDPASQGKRISHVAHLTV